MPVLSPNGGWLKILSYLLFKWFSKQLTRPNDAVTMRHCVIMGRHCFPHVSTMINTVMILIGDFDTLCKRVERKKQLIVLLGGFHSNPSHHTASWADNPSGEQKHLERERDGNLTGIIGLKFQAGTTGDSVLPCTWITNRVLCYHLVSCCTNVLSWCILLSVFLCACAIIGYSILSCRCQSHRSVLGAVL